MAKPKILIYDIETSHNVIAAFDLYNANPAANIIQERHLFSAAWKWYGKDRVHSSSLLDFPELFGTDIHNDLGVVSSLRDAIASADAVVAHYGDNFDMKMLNARMIKHGLPPLPPVIQIDTYKLAKKKFKFNSNKLDYLAQYLGFEGKMHTGLGLWLRALAGNKQAIREMVRYNKQDVEVLENVFTALLPYVPAPVNTALFSERALCPSCGGDHINYHGYTYTKQRKYRRFQCLSCGAWGRDKLHVAATNKA